MPRKPVKLKTSPGAANFATLVEAIADVHRRTQGAAAKAVNVALTCRNWLIGAYIHEYELRCQDRAEYGERLIDRLADALQRLKVPSSDRQRLYAYTAFFRTYPHIGDAILGQWKLEGFPGPLSESNKIVRSVTGKSARTTVRSEIVRSSTGITPISGKTLLDRF